MSAPAPVAARPARLREVVLRIALPSIPACTAVLGTGSVARPCSTAPSRQHPRSCGRSVVLALGTMAYDVGLRALRRRDD